MYDYSSVHKKFKAISLTVRIFLVIVEDKKKIQASNGILCFITWAKKAVKASGQLYKACYLSVEANFKG